METEIRTPSPLSTHLASFVMSISTWSTALHVCILLCSGSGVNGFAFSNQRRKRTAAVASWSPQRCTTRLYSATDEEEESKWEEWNPLREEKSQMPDYIASFLSDETKEDASFTHMIGVPMDDCHELLLELESVQRAIIYHCPILVHACIVPAITRMPLMYVQANDKTVATVTRTLHDIVERVVKAFVYIKRPPTSFLEPESEDEIMGGVNDEGYRPLVLSFQNLEIDGKENEVLHTVAMDGEGSTQLTLVVQTLKREIEALGWKVSFPPDDHCVTFRPRVPFMRLPGNFETLLKEVVPLEDEGQEEWMRTSDQGGNGISPIFWCQWWEDVMARSVRLREISVYPRQPGATGLGEQAFYIPHETTTLPGGNDYLTKAEARHRSYNDKRMAEAEGLDVDDDMKKPDDDIKYPQVEQQRERLESIYAAVDAALIDADVKAEIEQSLEAIVTVEEEKPIAPDPKKDDASQAQIDEWARERIRKAVEAREFVRAQKVGEKNKPKIEDNPVFQKYRDGTLVDKKEIASPQPAKELPAYPSQEHFIGIWRVVTSPTGWPEEVGDDTKSDNLILRVDGTVAGGPTLDRETNQKASGGTWKIMKTTDDDGIKLRIRLIIPPKKERILIMEGEVTRFTSAMDMSLSKSTFGIPELEAAAQKTANDMEDLIHCGGPVWIEDAVTGKNREEIGTFSLMKLQSPLEPGKYTITIPRPVRNQD